MSHIDVHGRDIAARSPTITQLAATQAHEVCLDILQSLLRSYDVSRTRVSHYPTPSDLSTA